MNVGVEGKVSLGMKVDLETSFAAVTGVLFLPPLWALSETRLFFKAGDWLDLWTRSDLRCMLLPADALFNWLTSLFRERVDLLVDRLDLWINHNKQQKGLFQLAPNRLNWTFGVVP